MLDHVSNCLNDAKKQSVFPLLVLLYDVQQFKSGEPVSVADVSINEVSKHSTPCLNKNKQNYFCYNYVKLPPNLTIFGTMMANCLKLYEAALISHLT